MRGECVRRANRRDGLAKRSAGSHALIPDRPKHYTNRVKQMLANVNEGLRPCQHIEVKRLAKRSNGSK